MSFIWFLFVYCEFFDMLFIEIFVEVGFEVDLSEFDFIGLIVFCCRGKVGNLFVVNVVLVMDLRRLIFWL